MTTSARRAVDMHPGETAQLQKRAHNAATESENKIHDDAEARRLGLRGGLVPGVTLYAHLTELVLPLLGPEWLRRGVSAARFVRPIYEGETVSCAATRAAPMAGGDGALRLDLAVLNQAGETCVVGSAALLAQPASAEARAWTYGEPPPAESRAERPLLTRERAPLGVALQPRVLVVDTDAVAAYADETGDATPWYRGGSPFGLPLVPPGLLAGQPARLLRENFVFGPSVHAGSEIQHLGLPLAGGAYTVSAALLETFTKRGSDYLVADLLIRDHADAPVLRIRHTSIFNFAPR